MTPESEYLTELARRHAAVYAAVTGPRAVLLCGSAAEGLADRYSDLDMSVYYDAVPSASALAMARGRLGATHHRWLAPPGELAAVEQYRVRGVECQVGHVTVPAWEADMARVLVDHEVDTPLQKALHGLLAGVPLAGDELIAGWRARAAAYPDALARKMVEHHLRFFPLWYLADYLAPRDAALWVRRELLEAAERVLGVLSGLNRRYFTTFQFKRLRRHVEHLPIRPPDLAARLERLVDGDQPAALLELESLARETVDLVRRHMPEVDTADALRRLGERQRPWTPHPIDSAGA